FYIMPQSNFKVYRVRWIMLTVYMLMVAVNQLLWITFAPITGYATKYYGVSDLQIGILSMCFMIVYIVVSVPASWAIDKYGIRIGVGIGAVFTGIFGLIRGFAGTDYQLLLIAQIGIAIGQPFILNAITKLAARWFPIEERATAAGLGTLAMYIGILAGMTLTPYLIIGSGIGGMLYIYGIISIITAFVFIVLIKEGPPTAPCRPDQEERSLVFDGFRQTLRTKDFIWLMVIFFIGLGVFNSVTTWIEDIMRPRGFSATQAGITGGLMIIGGIIGALIIPLLSDHYKKRTPFMIIALIGATLGLTGITFATSYWLLLTSGMVLGFFLLSAGPIGFQYGAEITYPASEGTSNGMLLLMGQISGIAFIFGMDSLKSSLTGSMTRSLIILIGLMFLSILMSLRLKESTILIREEDK
ncbi:MAG: MFS transporter, partial [Bacteroidales bacterium]|nr:MFS transporter [Bacteroidales bacterium]